MTAEREHLLTCGVDGDCECGEEPCQLCGRVVPAGQRLLVKHTNGEKAYVAGALCHPCIDAALERCRDIHGTIEKWNLAPGAPPSEF